MVHDLTERPSSSTVQAPQDVVSQPMCVPVRPSRSRSTETSSSRGSIRTSCAAPLTVSVTVTDRIRENVSHLAIMTYLGA